MDFSERIWTSAAPLRYPLTTPHYLTGATSSTSTATELSGLVSCASGVSFAISLRACYPSPVLAQRVVVSNGIVPPLASSVPHILSTGFVCVCVCARNSNEPGFRVQSSGLAGGIIGPSHASADHIMMELAQACAPSQLRIDMTHSGGLFAIRFPSVNIPYGAQVRSHPETLNFRRLGG
eukprot:2331805-Rhodomonas_salina.3